MVPRRLGQEDCCEFQANLHYLVRLCLENQILENETIMLSLTWSSWQQLQAGGGSWEKPSDNDRAVPSGGSPWLRAGTGLVSCGCGVLWKCRLPWPQCQVAAPYCGLWQCMCDPGHSVASGAQSCPVSVPAGPTLWLSLGSSRGPASFQATHSCFRGQCLPLTTRSPGCNTWGN